VHDQKEALSVYAPAPALGACPSVVLVPPAPPAPGPVREQDMFDVAGAEP
jgi:hypothetical protein